MYTFNKLTAADFKWITVTSDLKVEDVTAKVAVEKMAVKSAKIAADGKSMVITFNEAVTKDGSDVAADDFTVSAAGKEITSVAVAGKTVTLTFNTALVDTAGSADTVTVKSNNANISGAGIANNIVKTGANVITVANIGTTGVCTIG